MVFAIDIGTEFCKFFRGKRLESFPSCACLSEDRWAAEKVISFEGENGQCSYLVGFDCEMLGDPMAHVNTFDDCWPGSDSWIAVFYSALVQAGLRSGTQVQVGLGLPMGRFPWMQGGVRARLEGQHSFTRKGEDFVVEIEPIIIPQVLASLYSQSMMSTNVDVMLVDIGAYSTGFAMSKDRQLLKHKSGGNPFGFLLVVERVQDHMKRLFGYECDSRKMAALFDAKAVWHQGERIDVAQDMRSIVRKEIEPLLHELLRMWKDQSDQTIFLTGGWARLCTEEFIDVFPSAHLANEPFFSTVNGLRKLVS